MVARFLALLELYREGLVAFVQEQALEELTVRWTGPADGGDRAAGRRVRRQPGTRPREPAGARRRRRRRGGTQREGALS